MLANYFKIAWRHLLKSKFHSAINILGLSIGIGFSMLIAGYVWSELKVNSALRNADRQYIIQSKWKDPNMGLDLTTVGPLAKALKEQYPQLVANYYRWDGVTSSVSKNGKVFREGLQVGDSTLLTMFGFRLLHGDSRTALNEPFTAVITEDRALKYFGKTNVVGETLTIESFSGSKHDFKITGVMQMPTDNSVTHLTPENDNQVYIGTASIGYFGRTLDAWNDPYRVAYIELQKGIQPHDLQRPMQDLLSKNAPPEMAANMKPYLASLKTYYMNQFDGLVKKMLYTVSAIALFILLMAIVNFVNLSIGKSAARIKEIGIRKVMGSLRRQLVLQFLIEAILLVAFATVLAFGIYAAGKPFLTEVLGKELPSFSQFPAGFVLIPLVLIFLIGIIAGIYPAFVLSKLKATDSVKGKLHSVNANILLRKTLVGFQICSASVVLIGVLVTVQQVSLFFSKNIGYDKDKVVSVQVPRDWTLTGVQKMLTVRNELERLPQVETASLSWSIPNGMSAGSTMLFTQEQDSTQAVAHETIMSDEAYLDVFKIPLQAGRYFRDVSDSLTVVVNEAAVKALGYKTANEAIGKKALLPGRFAVTILGVTKDFHFTTMKESIKPLLILHVALSKNYRMLCFKLGPGSVQQSMEAIQKKWALLLPGSSFEYKFMDDALKFLYTSEIRLKKAAQLAMLLAITIVLLGISGLISLNIQRRTKEIGIRKVVGASSVNIIILFLKDFLPVVATGGVISLPVAWYLMREWLNDYAYRIDLSYVPFLASIGVLLALSALLISLQTSKISVENPVKNLRTE